MFLLTFHVEELIQIRKKEKNSISVWPRSTPGKWHAAHLVLPSFNLKVNSDGQGLWVPSLTLQHSVRPHFPLIFSYMSTIIAQCLGPKSPSFQHNCQSYSTSKSFHWSSNQRSGWYPNPNLMEFKYTASQAHDSSSS